MSRLIVLPVLAVLFFLGPRAVVGQEQGENQAVVTVRGTALLPTGEPAAKLPIVATVRRPHAQKKVSETQHVGLGVTVGSGSTRADGSFSFQIRLSPWSPSMVLFEFGEPTETLWQKMMREVDPRMRELDLKTVQLNVSVETKTR